MSYNSKSQDYESSFMIVPTTLEMNGSTNVNALSFEIIKRQFFHSPEMRATRFHTVTWDREHEESAGPREDGRRPSLILQSKFAVEQSRVYTRPGQDIGHYGPSRAFVFYKTYSPYAVPSRRPSR